MCVLLNCSLVNTPAVSEGLWSVLLVAVPEAGEVPCARWCISHTSFPSLFQLVQGTYQLYLPGSYKTGLLLAKQTGGRVLHSNSPALLQALPCLREGFARPPQHRSLSLHCAPHLCHPPPDGGGGVAQQAHRRHHLNPLSP